MSKDRGARPQAQRRRRVEGRSARSRSRAFLCQTEGPGLRDVFHKHRPAATHRGQKGRRDASTPFPEVSTRAGRVRGRAPRGPAHASVKWLVTVKIVYGSRQFLSDRRASGSARFLTLLFALYEGDTWSPAHGAVRWVRGAISLAALDSGQT